MRLYKKYCGSEKFFLSIQFVKFRAYHENFLSYSGVSSIDYYYFTFCRNRFETNDECAGRFTLFCFC